MDRKIAVSAAVVGSMFVLGFAVNPVFFYVGVLALCPLMHIFMGCGSGQAKNKKRKGNKCH